MSGAFSDGMAHEIARCGYRGRFKSHDELPSHSIVVQINDSDGDEPPVRPQAPDQPLPELRHVPYSEDMTGGLWSRCEYLDVLHLLNYPAIIEYGRIVMESGFEGTLPCGLTVNDVALPPASYDRIAGTSWWDDPVKMHVTQLVALPISVRTAKLIRAHGRSYTRTRST